MITGNSQLRAQGAEKELTYVDVSQNRVAFATRSSPDLPCGWALAICNSEFHMLLQPETALAW